MHSIFTKKSNLLACFLLLVGSSVFAQSAENTAMNHLRNNLKELSLTEADISNYKVSDEVYTQHNGVTSIYFIQKQEDIEVFNAMINVNILPNGEILGMGNRYIPNLAEKVNTRSPQISMENAIAAVQNKFDINTFVPLFEKERISETEAYFEESGIALEPIKVKLVLQPMEEEVRLAWNVTLYELSAKNWWNARVDAVTGEVLHFYNHVIHCNFGTPGEVCTEDHVHHHAGVAKQEKTMLAPPPVSNAYNVYAIPLTSPDHGDQTLELNPAVPNASPFGWHDTDGEPGHEFTITRGNNAHAYHDAYAQNVSTGNEPDGGDSLVFDFNFNEIFTQPYTQADATITNLFYWNNVMHDFWYQYGFDEAAGNFQENNYGNGGQGGDYVRAEALDGSDTGNANFATPDDGARPRMQMFLWGPNASVPTAPETSLEVTAPASVAGEYTMRGASFGAPLPTGDDVIISELVLVTDSVGVFSDACEDILNGNEFAGKIAMIDRGDCQFGTKVLKAEQQGAIAVIICNQMNNGVVGMPGGVDGDDVTIPSAMVSLADCNTIKMGLPNLEVVFGGASFELPLPGPTGRGSDLDNGVIAHEYGHGISNRLTGGPNNSGCLGSVEQAGEGWSDWFGLVMQTTIDNTAEEGRGIGTYVQFQPPGAGGIREHRYSRNMGINPHTYASIPANGQVHATGSVWCAMIWDLYWNMVDKHGFDEDSFNGTGGNNITMQLVIDGLKLQPCNPNFIESRDAIIDADIANNNGENVCLIWETFARRGLGASAVEGGNEAFDVPALCFDGIRVFKTAETNADAGTNLMYTLEIVNGTTESLADAMVTDILPAGTTYVEGSLSCNGSADAGSVDNGVLTVPFSNLESESFTTCTYEVAIAQTPFSTLDFEDDFELGSGKWIRENSVGDINWKFNTFGDDAFSGIFTFLAENIEEVSDQYLILEDEITLGQLPTVSFWHRYNTEIAFDGGVVEITTDGGQSWQDLGPLFTQNGYNATISATANSVLAGQSAFTGNSGEYQQSIIDLADFSGETVQIRFRFATDDANGSGKGWIVDDVLIYGDFHSITNNACITNGEGDEICSEITTIVFGEAPNATIDNQLDADISIYPNPAQSQFFVKMENAPSEKVQLTVRGIDGRVMTVQQRNAFETMQIDVSNFGAGVYVVELLMEEGVAVRKLVIE